MGDLERFTGSRQADWVRLERGLARVERSGLDSLPATELRDLGALYRRASADLVYAESILQNAELAAYLNRLVAGAYGVIYQRSRFSWAAVADFFARTYPRLVRARSRAVAASTLLFLAGMAGTGAVVLADREAFYHAVPSDYWRVYGEKPADLRAERFGRTIPPDRAAAFSAQIFTNNIRVCLMAFALGIAFGIPTAISIFFNGALLGAIAANFHRFGMDLEFWGLIVPHGGVEISCIFIAGGAGFALGGALLRPGRRSRGEAAKDAGREAMLLALGTAPFLVLAGLIEGLVTPAAAIGPWPKIAIGAVTGAGFWAYLLLAGRRRA